MVNKKILMSGFSIFSALALMGGSAFALFTAQATSSNNVLEAGTMTINILDQNQDSDFVDEALASNWAPGDETVVSFDVKNNGTLPVNLSGFAGGTWGSAGLDAQNAVRVTKVEHWNGAAWVTLMDIPAGITGTFYYTNDGTTSGTAFDVNPGQRAQLRLTVKFDESATDDFQGASFNSQITVNAKQVSAPW